MESGEGWLPIPPSNCRPLHSNFSTLGLRGTDLSLYGRRDSSFHGHAETLPIHQKNTTIKINKRPTKIRVSRIVGNGAMVRMRFRAMLDIIVASVAIGRDKGATGE